MWGEYLEVNRNPPMPWGRLPEAEISQATESIVQPPKNLNVLCSTRTHPGRENDFWVIYLYFSMIVLAERITNLQSPVVTPSEGKDTTVWNQVFSRSKFEPHFHFLNLLYAIGTVWDEESQIQMTFGLFYINPLAERITNLRYLGVTLTEKKVGAEQLICFFFAKIKQIYCIGEETLFKRS